MPRSGFSNAGGPAVAGWLAGVVAAAALGAADFDDELSGDNPRGKVKMPTSASMSTTNNGCDFRSSICNFPIIVIYSEESKTPWLARQQWRTTSTSSRFPESSAIRPIESPDKSLPFAASLIEPLRAATRH